ncbi:hypothetical protein [Paraburkholderia sp. J8-2]|uniref:hypothetical protein n=1 Tax=Paraburkholderia sp. J8-2 TaxID=2805440 RepID=UPI002AB791F2|nr:hypothetical protein [Paraburkholderia sp. J8-2]
MILFVSTADSTLLSGPHAERFWESIRARAIPHYFAGAVSDLDGQSEPRDLVWTAGRNHVVALGDTVSTVCSSQGIAHEVFPDPEATDSDVWRQIDRQLDSLASRLPLDGHRYTAIRDRLSHLGYRHEWEWAHTVTPPEAADAFAYQAIWVICCSGFRAQAARVTEQKVLDALAAGRSATDVFPRSGKGRAIDTIWANRSRYFAGFRELVAREANAEAVIEWLAMTKIPYVGGGILRYHFAKNLGIACAKPDRHLARLVGVPEGANPEQNFHAVMALCRRLAEATHDKVGAVDLVLWRACNLGILMP